ncbi:ABC transporter substrate-binding protein [Streptosporangium sp. NPDC049644]|uniref:ABC transporter substrate-binding protein n=1 Tax=Streptosporangium sp. NPDC049644 TaxID=3155507 RepID=UPI0034219AB9
MTRTPNAVRSRRLVAAACLTLATTLGLAACGSDAGSGPATDAGSGTAAAEDLGVNKAGQVSVGFMNGLMPYVGLEKGALTGVEGELFTLAAKDLGLEVQAQGMEFSAMIAGVQAGRYDIGIGGISWTKDRSQVGVMSDPIYYSPALMLTRPGVKATSVTELKGLNVGAVTGSINDEAVRATPDVKARTYPAWAQAISDLAAGRLDAINIDPLTAVYLRDTRPDLKNLEVQTMTPPTDEEVAANPGLQGFRPYQVVWYCSKKAEKLCGKLDGVTNGWFTSKTSGEVLTKWGVNATDFLTATPEMTTVRKGVDRPDTWTAPTAGEGQ